MLSRGLQSQIVLSHTQQPFIPIIVVTLYCTVTLPKPVPSHVSKHGMESWTEVACKVKPCPTRASKRTIMVPLYQAFHHGSYPLWGSISSGEFQGPNVRICCSDIRPIRRISTESSLSSVQTSSHNTDTHVNNMFALISVVDVSAYQLTG